MAIIAACIGFLYLYSFTDSLVHGYLNIDSGDATYKLKLKGNFFRKEIEISDSEPTEVNYRVLRAMHLTISQTQDGNSLELESYGPWGDLSRIKIKNNETISLKIGPPLVIKPAISNYRGRVTIGFTIVGQAGETYKLPGRKIRPKVKIMDENENIIASGNFSYG